MDEFITIIKSLEGNLTKEEIQEIISKANIYGNGRVNFEEFLHIIEIKMKVKNSTINTFFSSFDSPTSIPHMIKFNLFIF